MTNVDDNEFGKRCCCCFNTKNLFNMLKPLCYENIPQLLTTMITECFHVQMKSTITEQNKINYFMCKNCISRLKDAIEFRQLIQNAYDRLEGHFTVVSVDNIIYTSGSDSEIKPYYIPKTILESDNENNLEQSMITSDDDDLEDCNIINKTRNTSIFKKIKRNSGQEYSTKSGKIIPAKKFENRDCNCSRKCINLISETERKSIFQQFWNMADFNKQNVFLYASTRRYTVKTRRPKNSKGTPRTYTYKYYLNEDIMVCKNFFLNTFNISSGRLFRILNTSDIGKDMRGKMEGSRRKIDELLLNDVREHIKSFPTFDDDQSPSSGRKYLSSELNVKKMFKLYLRNCNDSNMISVNESIYRKVFKNEFDLHFHQTHKNKK